MAQDCLARGIVKGSSISLTLSASARGDRWRELPRRSSNNLQCCWGSPRLNPRAAGHRGSLHTFWRATQTAKASGRSAVNESYFCSVQNKARPWSAQPDLAHNCTIHPATKPSHHYVWLSCLELLATLLSDRPPFKGENHTYQLNTHAHIPSLRLPSTKPVFLLCHRIGLFSQALQRPTDNSATTNLLHETVCCSKSSTENSRALDSLQKTKKKPHCLLRDSFFFPLFSFFPPHIFAHFFSFQEHLHWQARCIRTKAQCSWYLGIQSLPPQPAFNQASPQARPCYFTLHPFRSNSNTGLSLLDTTEHK